MTTYGVDDDHGGVSGHGGSHDHDHGRAADANRRALTLTLVLTSSFMAAEVVGGLITGSLALLADAAHMLSDALSLALALGAVWLASKPETAERTFGYKRAEILAALANGVTLVAVSLWIFVEAARRFGEPAEILGGPMLAVAIVGLLVNAVAIRVLHGGGHDSLNVSAALRHVIADLLGSVGVILAAVIILLTGWTYADPLISVVIGILILGSSWGVLRDSTQVLLEGSPKNIDVERLGKRLAGADGIAEVHDLHVWEITSGFPALSAHVLVAPDEDCHQRRRDLESLLNEEFGLTHTTLQVDHVEEKLLDVRMPDGTPAGARRPPSSKA